MTYINSGGTINIHRTTDAVGDSLVLENLTTHKIMETLNIPAPTKFNYSISSGATGLDEWEEGQYSYAIKKNGELIEIGIIQCGSFKKECVEYEVNNIKYKTYEY